MSNYVRYSKSTPGRELTPALWARILEAWANDPSVGSFDFDDFLQPISNTTDASGAHGWFIQDAVAGGTNESFASQASPDGVARLSADTGTDHFGIELHRGMTATNVAGVNLPTHSTDPRGRVVFEARVDLSGSDNYFVGLTEPIVEFLSATGTLPTSSDYIGFYRADSGDLKFVCANDNNGGTAVTDEATILTDAQITAKTDFVKLGFAVNRDQTVDIFVDGVSYRTQALTINSLALPIEGLTKKIATTRGATGDLASVAVDIDWIGTFVEAE